MFYFLRCWVGEVCKGCWGCWVVVQIWHSQVGWRRSENGSRKPYPVDNGVFFAAIGIGGAADE